ncbi:hypothetical protein HY041_03245 [Candidatus Roizmanbacteria bacterium]|nr:hypothetical protein [Candidatus Roizmanbacteria bacterium]
MNKLSPFNKGFSGGIQFDDDRSQSHQYALFFYLLGIILLFLIILLRLFQLTVVKGDYYRRLSEKNRIKELFIEPERGEIRDRKGFVVAKNISADLKKNNERLQSKRIYDGSEAIAPLIGYRQIADKNDFKNDNCISPLQLGDKIGKKGVEKVYDCDLRGRYGRKLIEIDAKGNYLKTLTVIPSENGKIIQLSFDFDLQKKAYELIKHKKAAAVGVHPKTGEVLFLVSSPSFDPQVFENQNTNEIQSYFTDGKKPLFNRTTEGIYPPGSLFKLVLAAGALEEKTIDEKSLVEDTGTVQAGPLKFGNWYFLQYGKTEGMVDIVKAIKRSNDIFFYKTGEGLGPDKIRQWAGILGYAKETGIGLNEAEGLIPSPFWKQETLKDRWYTGDTYNFSIGQGYVAVTPLQTVITTSVFANGGYLCKPKLLKGQESECKKVSISQKNLTLIREGMKEACSPGGTGWPLFDFKIVDKIILPENKESTQGTKIIYKPIQTACKTGTAESQAASGLPHAWITVFAPFNNPEIALTVLVEEAGQGSDVAGPIAKEILKTYFERRE